MSGVAQAAVVGNALLSFFPGSDQPTRERVQMAMLFAQRATDDALGKGLLADGYDHYRRQLMFLGWDARSPREAWDPDPRRRRALDQALGQIGATASDEYSQLTRWSVDLLRVKPDALLRFERRSLIRQSFQLLPCRTTAQGYVELVLYHEALAREQRMGGFLLGERVVTGARAELIRFNVRQFDRQFGDRVRRSLEQALARDVYAL